MRHEIVNNIYYIYDEENKVIFSLELTDYPDDQVVISTATEVFAGPVKLLKFSECLQQICCKTLKF